METQQTQKNTNTNKNNSFIPPINTTSKTEQDKTANPQKQSPEISKWRKLSEIVGVWATIALSIATVILAFATWRLANDSNRQVKATFEMLEISKQNMVIANTPYFSIDFTVFPTKPMIGKPLVVHVRWINVGKTPAINVRNLVAIYYDLKDHITKMKIIPDSSASFRIDKGMVPPTDGITQDVQSSYAFTEDMINAIFSGNRIITINICIKYEDIFGHCYWMTTRNVFDPNTQEFRIGNTGNEYIKLY